MSQSNNTSKLGHATLEDHCPLADDELDAVSGGWLPSGIPGAAAPVEAAMLDAAKRIIGWPL
jgi:hypothetical protein